MALDTSHFQTSLNLIETFKLSTLLYRLFQMVKDTLAYKFLRQFYLLYQSDDLCRDTNCVEIIIISGDTKAYLGH